MEELVKKFKKLTTVQLFAKVEKAKGGDREAMLQVLELRGQDTSNWRLTIKEKSEPKEELPKGVYIEEPTVLTPDEEEILRKYEADNRPEDDDIAIRLRAEKEESKKQLIKEKVEEKVKSEKTKKVKREKTEEELSDFNFKVGDEIEFTPHKSTDKLKGIIKKVYKCKYTKNVYVVINSNKKNFLKRANAI